MFFDRFILAATSAALLAFAGCETIYNATLAQEEVNATISPDSAAADDDVEFVDLTDFTLADYVEFALSNRPEVASSYLALSNACLSLRMITAGEYPLFDFGGGYSQSTHNGPHFSWRQQGAADATFRMELLIYDFGRLEAQEQEARENIMAASRELAETQLKVFGEVTRAYFTLRQNDALLEVACTNEAQFADHLRQARTLYEAGETKNLDVLKARLDLSNARLETIVASNNVTIAAADFIRSLGLNADTTERWDVLAPAPDSLKAATRDLPVTVFNVTEAMALSRTNSPALMALHAKVRAASARVDYAVSELLPSLSLDASFAYVDPAWNFGWGVNAIQSLFQGYRKTSAVDSAVVSMYSAREDLFRAEQQLAYDLAAAIATRDTAAQTLANAEVQVLQARENLDNVMAQYRVGEASRIDFTDAATAFSSAAGAKVKAFYSGQIAESALVRLMGTGVDYE